MSCSAGTAWRRARRTAFWHRTTGAQATRLPVLQGKIQKKKGKKGHFIFCHAFAKSVLKKISWLEQRFLLLLIIQQEWPRLPFQTRGTAQHRNFCVHVSLIVFFAYNRASLKRSLAIQQSFRKANPPLAKMGHVNSQSQLPAEASADGASTSAEPSTSGGPSTSAGPSTSTGPNTSARPSTSTGTSATVRKPTYNRPK